MKKEKEAGKSFPHDSAVGHVTGQSIFIDDRPKLCGELEVGFLGSPMPAGRLKRLDYSDALKIPGVVAIFTARDFHHNRWGTIVRDQPILVENEIGYAFEPLCVIAAETRAALEQARSAIHLEIESGTPIFTIEEAARKNLTLYRSKGLVRGDAEKAISRAPHRISGVLEIGGQEHFYLESQASIAYPLENGNLEIHSSTQHPTEVQHVCAEALGLKHHQVVCIVKRMGGAFGGKESQAAPFAAMAALVAHRLKRPARIVLSKDDDMRVTGKRHPFKNHYEVGFDSSGKILGLKILLQADGGAYTDLSSSVLERALFHADGAYFITNAQFDGVVYRTHSHSNTAFRGFGGPQGNLTIETILEEMAVYLKKDPYEVRQVNLYDGEDRNITPYGQKVENNLLPEIFSRLHQTSEYSGRYRDLARRNERASEFVLGKRPDRDDGSNCGKLHGIAMTACKFGLAFNARFLNQAQALVHIHRDGTVQVSTGATEMGQGVNTKIKQVVADAFGLPPEDVLVTATATDKNANTSPTAASSGADLNCAAALKACEKIKARLSWVAHCLFSNLSVQGELPPPPVTEDKGNGKDSTRFLFSDRTVSDSMTNKALSWGELINHTYFFRYGLSEYGFHRTEGLDFDEVNRKGNAFKYFTTGAAVSEVEIDEYTGDIKIIRSDILMDLGRPLNPDIDRGQVAGAFIQGAGWMTTESLSYDPNGHLLSHSPTTYKIPNIQDTPRTFNISWIHNDQNTGNILGSKAAGEPPLLLSASIFLAIKNALSYRTKTIPKLKCPATPEEILMALSHDGTN